MSPKVSIIIPVYNGAAFISEAIESIFNQSFQDFELIVIDDGSTDETQEIVHQFGKRLAYFYQKNQGRAATRNAGLKKAKGLYVAFLDADDFWNSDRLERGVRVLDSESDIGLVHGTIEIIDSQGNLDERQTKWAHTFYRQELKKGSGYVRLLQGCAIFSSAVLFRREFIDQVGYYDESFPIYEDYDWYLRFALKYRMKLLEGPALIKYRLHPSNSFTQFTPDEIAKIYLAILDKQLNEIHSQLLDRKFKSHVLKKMVEFHWRLHDKAHIKTKAFEIARLNPRLFLDLRLLIRFMLSL